MAEPTKDGVAASGLPSYDIADLVGWEMQPDRSLLPVPIFQRTGHGNWTPPPCLICGGKRCAYCVGSGPRV